MLQAHMRFWNYWQYHSLNCTPLGPVTINNNNDDVDDDGDDDNDNINKFIIGIL